MGSKVALAAQQELGGVKLTDLPGPEALYEPGSRDGQQKMVRTGDAVSVHSWNMAEQKWDKIGDVVGAAGGSTETSGKKLYMGKEYDFVFDIEIDEPKATLKLPYNTTDSPFMAAQQFIHKHDLSQYYLEEIAQHIITHSGGQKLGAETGGNLDPLTGGSSYSAGPLQGGGGAPAAGGGAAGGFFDPLTGSGYGGVEMRQGAPPPDPWMQGAYRTEEAMDTGVEVKNSYFPQTEFLKFDSQVKAEPMVNKLKEFNSLVPVNLRLDPALIEKVPSLANSNTPDPDVSTTLKTLLSWPDAQMFPALDLLRASFLNPSSHTILLE